MKKWLVVSLGVGIGLLLLVWLFVEAGRVSVTSVEVKQQDIQALVDERAVSELGQIFAITMPLSGYHSPEDLAAGDDVVEGQLLASVSGEELEQEVRALQAIVRRVEAEQIENADTSLEMLAKRQMEQFVASMNFSVEAANVRTSASEQRMQFAERALGRERQLFDDQATSQERLERIELAFIESQKSYSQDNFLLSAFKAIQSATDLLPEMVDNYIAKKQLRSRVLAEQLEEAKAQLQLAQQRANRAKVLSPIDGKVLSCEKFHNQFVAAGTQLMELGDLNELQFRAEILSQVATGIKEGDRVVIYGVSFGPQAEVEYAGVVQSVALVGEAKRSSLNVEQTRVDIVIRPDAASLGELKKLGVGVNYQVRVKIFTEEAENAFVVPRSAIFRGPNGEWQLFELSSGKAELREIRIGIMNDQMVQVLEGVESGQRVVLAPDSSLQDGARVKNSE